MKIFMFFLLSFLTIFVKSQYNNRFPYETDVLISRFNISLNETFIIKVKLIFELNPEYINIIKTTHQQKPQTNNRFKRFSNERMINHFPTVDDAVENFRQNLIDKENNIAGIIESSNVFYRYFKLKYLRSVIDIRCTYHSDYINRKLKITCCHYNIYDNHNQNNYLFERDFNNLNNVNHRYVEQSVRNIETDNINDYTQELYMDIN